MNNNKRLETMSPDETVIVPQMWSGMTDTHNIKHNTWPENTGFWYGHE